MSFFKKYRNVIVTLVSGLPACLSVMALCLVGLIKTTAEMSDQNIWFVYSVLGVFGCAILTWVFNIRSVKPGIIDLIAALMFIWYVASYYINDSIAVSQLLEVCLFAIMFVSLRVLLSSYRNLGKWLFLVLCICGIVEAVTGMQQAFGARHSSHNLFNVTGTFFNPGPYGGYIAVIMSTALGYFVSRYRYADKIFGRFNQLWNIQINNVYWALIFISALCAIIAMVIILPSTMSRAAFVAVGTAVASIVLSNERVYMPISNYIKNNGTKSFAIAIISLFVISGSAYGVYALKKDSADGRLLMWKTGAKIMLKKPATGVGQGYFQGAYGDVQAEYFRLGERSETEIKIAGCPEYAFNEYLKIGAETGIPGLLLFVFLVGAALRQLFRSRSPYAYGLTAVLVFAFFSYPFSILPIKMLFVMLLAVAGAHSSKRRKAATAEIVATGGILAGSIIIAVFLTEPYIRHIETTTDWQDKRRWYSMDMYSYVLEDYPELFSLMKENPEYLFEYGRSLNMERLHAESLDILLPATRLSCDPMYYNVIGNCYKALKEYDKAAEAYLKAWYIIPHRMYPLYLLGKMYSEINDRENAVHYARRVVNMIPKVESPATRNMQEEMKAILENIETLQEERGVELKQGEYFRSRRDSVSWE